MCSSPKMPAPPAPPPPPPASPTADSATVMDARDRERRRQMAASGMRSTMLTGADGVTAGAPTAVKSLLGA